jgi:hypothetical protein
MDRRFAWLGAAVGALAVWRWRRRRQPAAEADPAESLRAKLEESRAVGEPEPQPAAPVDEGDLDARRRSVHDDARARMEQLRKEGG